MCLQTASTDLLTTYSNSNLESEQKWLLNPVATDFVPPSRTPSTAAERDGGLCSVTEHWKNKEKEPGSNQDEDKNEVWQSEI